MRLGTAVWGHCLLVVLLRQQLRMGLTMFPMATMDMVDMDTCLTGNSSTMESSSMESSASMGSLSMGSLARVCSRSGSDDIILIFCTYKPRFWMLLHIAFIINSTLFDVHLYFGGTLVFFFIVKDVSSRSYSIILESAYSRK